MSTLPVIPVWHWPKCILHTGWLFNIWSWWFRVWLFSIFFILLFHNYSLSLFIPITAPTENEPVAVSYWHCSSQNSSLSNPHQLTHSHVHSQGCRHTSIHVSSPVMWTTHFKKASSGFTRVSQQQLQTAVKQDGKIAGGQRVANNSQKGFQQALDNPWEYFVDVLWCVSVV